MNYDAMMGITGKAGRFYSGIGVVFVHDYPNLTVLIDEIA